MEIRENIALAQYTTLKAGGPAKFFCEAEDEEEILEALEFAEEKKQPVFVLGGGSNILVSDKGFDGVVIRLRNSQLVIRNLDIICDSGCQLSKVVSESVKAGLTGLEWAAGIPGTVGGAVWGNAGAFNGSMSEVVESVKVIEIPNPKSEKLNNIKYQILNLKNKECEFAYRDSIFRQNPILIILCVALNLKKGDKTKSEKRVREIIAQRKEKQPFDYPSSGSFFKNSLAKSKKMLEEFEKDTGDKAKNNVIPAGYLIDRLGLRGKKIGGAMVSQAHGNFLVNSGKAKAEDFIILAAIIKSRVRNKFGIQLKEEVQMVGF
ncbi:MAG: UDP-N-acetylenolpyruvoylglucosamine reductase [Candidatus Moranbacteria bacterium RIFOXYB1_FULL_43_19]|nr:MAG: UDP-N-acetylenolpyruvoylglucosamine reductase [Candidatus Moranbacteria bacterium RIFOXYB1_FULL_43_19]OGI28462.1 MAG: UDP-N-acetylenolpyruvoylglucosamine reductase [Candidatus Moranbacteria bacterium RIFOXYA1_FULL_44_7]OGI33312.1 MAG: UDP-N-acetylenolpyruvoylglucosamine reductase [Candidatus Moranbacteria bacterium RIFOXYC1_FULL_44_13]